MEIYFKMFPKIRLSNTEVSERYIARTLYNNKHLKHMFTVA